MENSSFRSLIWGLETYGRRKVRVLIPISSPQKYQLRVTDEMDRRFFPTEILVNDPK